MFRKFVLLHVIVISQILVQNISCRKIESLESMESDSITTSAEPSILQPPQTSRRNLGGLFPQAEDAIFSFINKLVNTGYASSKIALSRLEKANNKRKEMGEEIETILEAIPTYRKKIPFLDDLPQF